MRVERINDRHEIEDFTSGKEQLDAWLRVHALEHDQRNVARVYVLVDDDDSLLGYVTISMMSVRQGNAPRRLGSGLAGLEIPGVLVGRLAVSIDRQGEGLGRDLLVFATSQAFDAAERVAARFVAVDPIDDEAKRFYEHHGFTSVTGDPGQRMFLPMSQARHPFE